MHACLRATHISARDVSELICCGSVPCIELSARCLTACDESGRQSYGGKQMSWRKGVGGTCARAGGPLQRSHVGDPRQPPEFGRECAVETVHPEVPVSMGTQGGVKRVSWRARGFGEARPCGRACRSGSYRKVSAVICPMSLGRLPASELSYVLLCREEHSKRRWVSWRERGG